MKEKLENLKKRIILQKNTMESLKHEKLTKKFVERFIDVMKNIYDEDIKIIDEVEEGLKNGK